MRNGSLWVVCHFDLETQGGNEILVGQVHQRPGDNKKTAGGLNTGNPAGPKGVLVPSHSYRFNNCFGEDTTTEELYERTVKRLVKSSLSGVNGTVFAYGPTGSGKTFTMMGGSLPTLGISDPELDAHQGKKQPQQCAGPRTSVSPIRQPKPQETSTPLTDAECRSAFRSKYEAGDGLIIMAVRDLFRQIGIEASQGEKSVSILCSFLEIYNDQVYDLLRPHEKLSEELPVVENEFFTRGETEAAIESLACLAEHLRRGEASRQYAKTHMNHKSSRSHTIFRLKIRVITQKEHQMNTAVQNIESLVADSVLNFVDLAGSEKLAVHDSPRGTPTKPTAGGLINGKQDRIKETKSINKSLFFLTQVISQLSKGCKDIHVPYRNSTLTKLLKNSLGGNARTALVLCISPAESYMPHTLSTLRFGVSARRVCNNVKTNVYESCNLASLKNQIQAYEHRINQLELDNSKQRNESEELIEMVKRLMDQKKELVERLVQLQNDPKMLAAPELLSKERNQVIAQTMSIHMELEQAILKHSTVINSLSPSKPSASKVDYSNTPKLALPDTKSQARAARLAARVVSLKQRLASDRQQNRKQARLLVELLGSDLRPAAADRQIPAAGSVWAALTDNTLHTARRRIAAAMKRLNKELLRREVGKGVQRVLGLLATQSTGQPTASTSIGTVANIPEEGSATGIVNLLKSLSWAGCTDAENSTPKDIETQLGEEVACLGKRRPVEGIDGLEEPPIMQSQVFAPMPPTQTEATRTPSSAVLDILNTSGLLEPHATLEDDLRILPQSLHESLIRIQLKREEPSKIRETSAMLTEQFPHQLETWVVPSVEIKPQVHHNQRFEPKTLSLADCFNNLASKSIMVEEDDVISVVSGCDLLDDHFEFNTGKIPITAQKCDDNFVTVIDGDAPHMMLKEDCNMISIVDLTRMNRDHGSTHRVVTAPEVVIFAADDILSQAALSFQERPHEITKESYSKFNKLAAKKLVLESESLQRPPKPAALLPPMQLQKVLGHSLEVPVPRHVISRSLSDHQALELEGAEESPERHSNRTDSDYNIFHRPEKKLDFHCPEPDSRHILRQRPNNDVLIVSPQKAQRQSGSKDEAKFMTPQSGRNSSAYHYTMNKQQQTGAFSFDRSSNKVHRRLETDLLRVAMSPKENKPSGALKSAGATKLGALGRPKIQPTTSRFPSRR